jgi:hypothetical protein
VWSSWNSSWLTITRRALLIQAALRVDLTLAHLARCAAAILRRAETDIVRFFGSCVMPFVFAQRAL